MAGFWFLGLGFFGSKSVGEVRRKTAWELVGTVLGKKAKGGATPLADWNWVWVARPSLMPRQLAVNSNNSTQTNHQRAASG